MKRALKDLASYISMTMSIIALVSALFGYFVGVKITQHDVEELKREMIESYKLHYQHKEVTGRMLEFMGD